jgi:hypothetical protein
VTSKPRRKSNEGREGECPEIVPKEIKIESDIFAKVVFDVAKLRVWYEELDLRPLL